MRKKIMTVLCILAAFLCFLYCFIVFRIRSGSRFYMIWALGGMLFVGLALMIKFDLWSQFPPLLRRVVCGFLIVGIAAFVIAEGAFLPITGTGDGRIWIISLFLAPR